MATSRGLGILAVSTSGGALGEGIIQTVERPLSATTTRPSRYRAMPPRAAKGFPGEP
jgi:hypothetical protein